MNLFEKLKTKFGAGKIKKEQIDRLRQIISVAVSDGIVTEQELGKIHSFYFESNLTDEDFQQIKSIAFMDVVEMSIADRRVTETESNALEAIAKQFEINPNVLRLAKQKVQYFELFSQIDSGAELPTGNPTNLILKKGESAHLSIPAHLIEERVTIRQYSGGSRGVSVPIVKGIRFNVGAHRGHSYSITNNIPVSDGYFIATNKRLVFSGTRKSVSSDIPKLLDFQVFADGIQFSVTSRQKPTTIKFDSTEEAELCALVVSRIINES